MNPTIKQMRILINQIRLANHLYYVMDDPTLKDEEYDGLVQELKRLEDTEPGLVQPDSPLNDVGGTTSGSLKQVEHVVPMLSLGNVFNLVELEDWIARIRSKVKVLQTPTYVLEYKFDGLAVSLIYVHGKLVQGVTRGTGQVGEDVTHKVLTISNIPQVLPSLSGLDVFEVRGEVVMSKAGFNKWNEEALKNGSKPFANARNAAAGSIRQLSNDKPRPLAFYAYSVNQGHIKQLDKQSTTLMGLSELGFSVGPFSLFNDVEEIQAQYEKTISERETLPYDIDGMVIKVDAFDEQRHLGFKTREPLWAVAYKFPAQSVLSTLESVDWQVGRTGQLTPVARIDPVVVGGTLVGNVTLHNTGEIKRLDIKIGDRITVERAGDVIPKITKVWYDARPNDALDVHTPKQCPSCDSPISLPEGEVIAYCTGGSLCKAQRHAALKHFVSRNAMDIDGLAENTLETLIEVGLVENFADIYTLNKHRNALLNLDKMGEKSVDKLLQSIENSKRVSLKRFLYSLGIRNVGEGTSLRLSRHYKTLTNVMSTTLPELSTIVDIGPITANQIYNYMGSSKNMLLITKLLKAGVTVEDEPSIEEGLPLAGQIWVITGSFEGHSRTEIKEHLTQQGATVASSVTPKTTVLLAPETESETSKYKKAIKLGTKIVSIF